MHSEKRLAQVSGIDIASGTSVSGYEIHIGQTSGADCDNFWLNMEGVNVGASSKNGRIQGCYIHGLFSSDEFRHVYLNRVGANIVQSNYSDKVELTLNALAKHMELHCDLDKLLEIASQN